MSNSDELSRKSEIKSQPEWGDGKEGGWGKGMRGRGDKMGIREAYILSDQHGNSSAGIRTVRFPMSGDESFGRIQMVADHSGCQYFTKHTR